MIKVAKNKTELNRFIKNTQIVFPEMTVETKCNGMLVTGAIPGIEVFSAMKCRSGWSLRIDDRCVDERSIEDKRQSLETSFIKT